LHYEKIFTIRDDDKLEMWIYRDGIYIPQAVTFIKEFCRKIFDFMHTNQLVNILTPCLFEGIFSIYSDATSVSKNEDMILINFQNLLKNVPKWNQNIITDETPSYKTVADLFGFATPVSTKKPLTPLPPPPPLTTSQINDIAFLQTYTRTTPTPIKKLPIVISTPAPTIKDPSKKIIQTKLETEISILPIITNTSTGYQTIADLMK
jgi:hypothetical protein